jgi:hypothetical protein
LSVKAETLEEAMEKSKEARLVYCLGDDYNYNVFFLDFDFSQGFKQEIVDKPKVEKLKYVFKVVYSLDSKLTLKAKNYRGAESKARKLKIKYFFGDNKYSDFYHPKLSNELDNSVYKFINNSKLYKIIIDKGREFSSYKDFLRTEEAI